MSLQRSIVSAAALGLLSLGFESSAVGQTCTGNTPLKADLRFRGEHLPIELSGFFPYVLDPADGSFPIKYTTETWAGAGMAISPACGCFVSYSNLLWQGAWTFSKTSFSDSSSKSFTGVNSGCGGGSPSPIDSQNIRQGLVDSAVGGPIRPSPTSVTATSAIADYPDDPTYSSCWFGTIFGHTHVADSLTGSFTLQDAKDRAEQYISVAADSGGRQFWNNNYPASLGQAATLISMGQLSRTSPVVCHAERFYFAAQFCGPCLGQGRFKIVYRYLKTAIGAPESTGIVAEFSDVREFTDPPYVIPERPYHVALKQGEQCRLLEVTAQRIEDCKNLEGGTVVVANHSVDMRFDLGKRLNGESVGSLVVASQSVSPGLYVPAAVQVVAADSPDLTVVRTEDLAVRQVKAPEHFIDVVATSPTSYELRFYHASQAGTFDTGTGLYPVSGQPFVVHLIENPDTGASNRIRFTETRGASQKVTLYTYDSTTDTMTMSTGNGLRVEIFQKTIAGQTVTETRTIKDSGGQTVSVVQETKYDFPFGRNLTQRVLDPAGAALTTAYTYYTDAANDGGAYGHLKQVVESTGRWTQYSYDAQGRYAQVVTQFLNSATGSAANLNRVSVTTYGTVADIDGDGQPEAITTTVDSLLGQEVGRSFEVVYSAPQTFNGQTVEMRASIRAISPGTAWNAAGNLVTTTRTVKSGTFKFKPMSVALPDETLSLYQYDLTGSTITTTVSQGQPNANKDAVISGTKTVTAEDIYGHFVAKTVTDIASNLVLSSGVATSTDDFGRPTRIDYTDGTFETFSYACCGLDSTRDRMGATTSYVYDDLGRVSYTMRAGLTRIDTYDPEGRLLTSARLGSDSTTITQQTNGYDVAGRKNLAKDALNRATSFVESRDASGNTVRTTTLPDLGTQISTYAKDGSLLSVSGTAAQQLAYEYGVDADGVFTKEIRVGSSGQTTEWVKSYVDLASRSYKKLYADNAVERNYYNSLGQLSKATDADGVATLFAYNGRGELEVTAVDLNSNDTIDYAGADRISRRQSDVTTHGTYTVQRTTLQVWETDNQDVPATTSVAEQGADGLRTWQTVRGLTTSTVTTLDGTGGRTVTTTAPDLVKTVQVFANERLQSTTIKTGSDVQVSTTTLAYDPHGRLSTTTDARNGTTTYTYFADDQVNTIVTPDPDPARSGAGYDPQTTTYAYDSAGRQNLATLPDASVVNTTYWPTGQVKRTWGSRTYPTEYTYDSQGRVKTLTTWKDLASDSGRAVTTWNYNAARGWLDNKRYADNTGPSYTYKPSGRLQSRIWARGITTTYSYNAAGDLSTSDYSDTTPDVTLAYDRAGHARTIADGAGSRTLSYHASGQLQDEIYASGLLNGVSIERDYDALFRLSGVTAANGAPVISYTYGYDESSRLQVVTQGTSTATYGYVPNSALVQSVTFAQGGVTRLTTTKVYDQLNRLTSIANTPSNATAQSVSYDYNSANQRVKATRETSAYWDYGYDALGQVTSAAKKLSNGDAMLGFSAGYAYDDIGNRKTATANSQTSTYTANSLNQYTQRTVPGAIDVFGTAATDATVTVNGQTTQRQGENFYRSLAISNTLQGAWTDATVSGVRAGAGPGGADAVNTSVRHTWTPKTPEAYSYDVDGNLTGDGQWTYSWDGENRLIACETRSDILPPASIFPLTQRRRLEFGYDGQSRRISKKVFNWNGTSWVLAGSTLFLYHGWNMVAELNAMSGNAAVRTFAWALDLSGGLEGAGGVGGLLFANLGSATHSPGYDGNGNVIGLGELGAGSWSASYDYNAFGQMIACDGVAARANPVRFSSKWTDEETDLIYYGFRFYSASAGRWLSRDPLGEEGGDNLYAFVANNSIYSSDFVGLSLIDGFIDQLEAAASKVGRTVLRTGASYSLQIRHHFQFPKVLKNIANVEAAIGGELFGIRVTIDGLPCAKVRVSGFGNVRIRGERGVTIPIPGPLFFLSPTIKPVLSGTVSDRGTYTVCLCGKEENREGWDDGTIQASIALTGRTEYNVSFRSYQGKILGEIGGGYRWIWDLPSRKLIDSGGGLFGRAMVDVYSEGDSNKRWRHEFTFGNENLF